ncbi:HAD domain-containing protein [Streptomyces sp. NPDC006458]|uniref:HAD domain-containing protein n=1 Tax=Streptomyces sp. NPDC006458 TaxID=3154302 RepID=UPI0033ABC955
MRRPLLYLDVDGPLNPYAAKPERRPEGYTTHRMAPEGWLARHPAWERHRLQPLRVWLNPEHGLRLRELSELYDLVWATTWCADANTLIAPVLGLPELPFVDWPGMFDEGPEGTFWKTRHVLAHAAGRPFAWVDDELRDADRAYVADHHPASALLHRIDARHGLRTPDFTTLRAFAHALSGSPDPDPTA